MAQPTIAQEAVHQKMPPRQHQISSAQRQYSSAVKKEPVQPPVAHVPPPVRPKGKGTLAVIIDDMGSSMTELQRLTAIGVPLTFSVIPGLAHSTEVARKGHDQHYQIMIHMPMEPEGYPRQKLEKNGLLLSQSEEEVRSRVKSYVAAVPFAEGANNHMGSRFTTNREKMQPVLDVLKGEGKFFVDSRTSPRSVGYSLAREVGVPAGTRQVFLDNVQNVAAITKQLELAASLARKKGGVIAICHPHPSTIQALAAALPRLQQEGITFVPASALLN